MPLKLKILLLAVIVSSITADVRWTLRPRENWAGAAKVLLSHRTSCILYEPATSQRLYTFFEPSLKFHRCDAAAASTIIAVSPYADQTKFQQKLSQSHFTRCRIIYNEGPTLLEYDNAVSTEPLPKPR